MERWSTIGLGVCLFLFGVVIGAVIANERISSALEGSLQIRSGNGRLTNPLLECDIARGTIDSPKIKFAKDLQDEIKNIEEENSGLEISVYYRDLNNGPTFGYDEDVPFIPASLLKVPTAMSLYKQEERERGFLDTTLRFTTPLELPWQNYPPPEKLVPGTDYTIRELVRRALQHSDNDALFLLGPVTQETELKELARQLDIEYPGDQVTVKEYSSVFRMLFNASYLSQEHSEEVLQILTQSSFKDGIPAGIPSQVTIAHKFGERSTSAGEQQFHDCGIIYYPDHPYLLCVMTKSPGLEASIAGIKRISAFVYERVEQAY